MDENEKVHKISLAKFSGNLKKENKFKNKILYHQNVDVSLKNKNLFIDSCKQNIVIYIHSLSVIYLVFIRVVERHFNAQFGKHIYYFVDS